MEKKKHTQIQKKNEFRIGTFLNNKRIMTNKQFEVNERC